jgi:hypothetical protein
MSEGARTSNVRRNQRATTAVALADVSDSHAARAIVCGTIFGILGQQGAGHILVSLRVWGVMDAYRAWQGASDVDLFDLAQDEAMS